jgi:hypothetical protein
LGSAGCIGLKSDAAFATARMEGDAYMVIPTP